jgi:exodeoxyribonuclease V beta subunit
MKDFNVNTVDLNGCKLIEASAGTGKTYSVGILVLRLLIEKKIKINQILMVTFTEAAVEELKSRIRSFVYQAWQYSKDKTANISEEGIKNYLDQPNKDPNEITEILNEAVSYLDEVSIFTIHGFCARTLKEFAFESQQNFDLKMLNDISEIQIEALNIIWRKNITTLPVGILNLLLTQKFNQDFILELSKAVLEGRNLSDPVLENGVSNEDIIADSERLVLEETDAYEAIKNYISQNKELVLKGIRGQKKSLKLYTTFYESIDFIQNNFDSFLTEFKNANKLKSFDSELFDSEFRDLISDYSTLKEANDKYKQVVLTTFYKQSAIEIAQEVQTIKNRRNVQTFDDLINNLHKTITSEYGTNLKKGLRDKYKAIFIDEFQDTDKLQYEIFSTAFSKEAGSILFYIGDPKQSIYAFRKADLDTYKLARNNSDQFTMRSNFRSNQALLDNLNTFFDVENPFNDPDIEYTNVHCGKTSLGNLVDSQGIEMSSFECFTYSSRKEIIEPHLVQKTVQLLTQGYKIREKETDRLIRPNDIGILVKSNKEAKEIKLALGLKGVPAVVVDDSKVFSSDVAHYVLYILQAINEVNDSSVYKALGTPLFLDHFNDIIRIDLSKEVLHFEHFKNAFTIKGVFSLFQAVLDTYNLRGNLLQANHKNGQRLITNLLHLVELLQNQQTRFKLNLEELIDWLQRAINGGVNADSSFEQRLENDENAVNIVTVHKSKGLAYNIVLAPYLDKDNKTNYKKTYQYKIENEYAISIISNQNPEAIENQQLQWAQEDKRLIYVALTRAVYYCGIYSKTNTKNPIGAFVKAWQEKGKTTIDISNEENDETLSFKSTRTNTKVVANRVPAKTTFPKQWSVLSYSSIAVHPTQTIFINNETPSTEAFEQFVFQKMPKGTVFGNFAHSVLETISFHDQSRWDVVIKKAAQKAMGWGHQITATQETELGLYHQWFEHICKAKIRTSQGSFQLQDVENKISELEFYFDYKKIHLHNLQKTLKQTFEIEWKNDLNIEGLMNGFIDLVFEQGGKYYILDWKTNYLGNSIEAYQTENLELAMRNNNYHLQYMIYTVALCRYLKTKITDFDYDTHFGGTVYFFVRGIRQGHKTGIYFNRFSKAEYKLLERMLG